MPKRARKLSAVALRRITKQGMHAVGDVAGLLRQVSPTGSRSWTLRATVGCKHRDMGLRAYPDVALIELPHVMYCHAADEVSELAMAHVNSDATRAAYARDELLGPRQ